MDNKVLAICIASFNKAQTTYNSVTNILSNKNSKLSVVVVDNASDDNTVELLKTVNDPRFKLVVNEENIGGAANMVKAVMSSDARFCMYINDRDEIYQDKLDDFIEFLDANTNITGGWCVRCENPDMSNYIILSRMEAFEKYCYRCEHPTGFFYNSEYLRKIDETRLQKYAAAKNFVPFPWEDLEAEMVCMGEIAIYNRVVWKSTGNTSHKKYVSSYVSLENISERWFSKENCLNRSYANVSNLLDLKKTYNFEIENNMMMEIIAKIFISQYAIASWRFKTILETDSLAYHYAVNKRKVPFKEIKEIENKMVKEFCKYIDKSTEGINSDDLEKKLFDCTNKENKYQRKMYIKSKIITFAKKLLRRQ